MNPEEANPNNFTEKVIIYNDGSFSIAYGKWHESKDMALAARWNGEDNDPNDKGYPKVFGNPMWFLITENLKDILLAALLSSPHSKKDKIIDILSKKTSN